MTPGTVAHQAPQSGISQAKILEWVAISFSRGLPNQGLNPGLTLEANYLLSEATGKPFKVYSSVLNLV